jgi:hypothetical protein
LQQPAAEDPREILRVLDFLAETMSRWSAAFAQAEEHARRGVGRAKLAAASLDEDVIRMQSVAGEQAASMTRALADTLQARTQAADALAGAQNASQRARALQDQARGAVGGWAASLAHARLRVESGRFEMSQAEVALAAAKETLAAKEAELAAAARAAGQDGKTESMLRRATAPPTQEPVSTGRLQRAVGACEHARKQLRFAVLRMTAAAEEVASAEGVVTRCQAGIEQASELVRSADDALAQASAALAFASESVSLGDAAVTALLRGQAGVARCAASTRGAAAAAAALSEELLRAAARGRDVKEGLAEHHALQAHSAAALDELREGLLQVAVVHGI